MVFNSMPCCTAHRGKKHRYVYCLAARRPTNLGNGLAKHDLETGEVKVWYEEGGMAGE
jgi:carotenoid cleavage dioxygenase-like enzyme